MPLLRHRRHLTAFIAVSLLVTSVDAMSQHCGRLQYWNPDNKCCGSCLQRFGSPCPARNFHQTAAWATMETTSTFRINRAMRVLKTPTGIHSAAQSAALRRPPHPLRTTAVRLMAILRIRSAPRRLHRYPRGCRQPLRHTAPVSAGAGASVSGCSGRPFRRRPNFLWTVAKLKCYALLRRALSCLPQ